jgi:hypothetical protein
MFTLASVPNNAICRLTQGTTCEIGRIRAINRKKNKTRLPKWIREYREDVLSELQKGQNVGVVFTTIVERAETELAMFEIT